MSDFNLSDTPLLIGCDEETLARAQRVPNANRKRVAGAATVNMDSWKRRSKRMCTILGGLRVAEFADLMGVSKITVTNWNCRYRHPNIENQLKLRHLEQLYAKAIGRYDRERERIAREYPELMIPKERKKRAKKESSN